MIRIQLAWLVIIFAVSFAPGVRAVSEYSVQIEKVEGHTTYHLRDSARHMDVGIVPDIGNFVYQFKVNGKDVLIPPASLAAYVKDRKFCCGIPFLAPWANRIAGDAYYFEGRKYLLNPELGNFLRDQFGQPIHGLVEYDSRWEVAKKSASDGEGAALTSRLEFYKYPDLMAQFPFAHTMEIRTENSRTPRSLRMGALRPCQCSSPTTLIFARTASAVVGWSQTPPRIIGCSTTA